MASLRQADHSSKESYSLYKKDYETEEEVRAQLRTVEPMTNKKGITIMHFKIRNFLFVSACVGSIYMGISLQYVRLFLSFIMIMNPACYQF
jgi:hypothetical protein